MQEVHATEKAELQQEMVDRTAEWQGAQDGLLREVQVQKEAVLAAHEEHHNLQQVKSQQVCLCIHMPFHTLMDAPAVSSNTPCSGLVCYALVTLTFRKEVSGWGITCRSA